MDDTVEKVDLVSEVNNLSAYSLFLEADLVVKIVIIILIFFSLWSWTIIFSKFSFLNRLASESDEFEEKVGRVCHYCSGSGCSECDSTGSI